MSLATFGDFSNNTRHALTSHRSISGETLLGGSGTWFSTLGALRKPAFWLGREMCPEWDLNPHALSDNGF